MQLENGLQRKVLISAAETIVDFEGDLCLDYSNTLSKTSPHKDSTLFDETLTELNFLRSRVVSAQGFIKYISELPIGHAIGFTNLNREIVDKGLEMLIIQYYDQITEPLYPGEIMKVAGLSHSDGENVYSLNKQNLVILREQVRHNVDLLTTTMDLLTELRK